MSSRRQKKAALAKWRHARGDAAISVLDRVELPAEDDIYDEVTEEEYQQTVRSRREREDFVVDDDGLGYYDDGEERFGEEAERHETNKQHTKKQKNSSATMTAKALQKARRLHRQADSTAEAGKNRSMWNFVNKAASSVSVERPLTVSSSSTTTTNLDDLLSTLDHAPTRRKRARRRHVAMASLYSSRRVKRERIQQDDDYDDEAPMVQDPLDEEDVHDEPMVDETPEDPIEESANSTVPPESIETAASVEPPTSSSSSPTSTTTTAAKEEVQPKEEEDVPAPTKRRRLVRSKLGDMSTAAKKALEAPVPLPPPPSLPPPSLPPTVAPPPVPTTMPSSVSLEQVIQTNEQHGRYLDLFWTDLAERNGDILLFGKVANQNDTPPNFVSACVVVTGNLRNLFVLPRRQDDGSPVPMLQVHQEINDLLHHQGIIPKRAGAQWKGKPVQRRYAFGDSTIPRDPTEYLKVVYDTAFPPPPLDVCQHGGRSFSHILNASAPLRETFLLKRQLMGPCWVRVMHCQPTRAPTTWCKVECAVASPKHIVRWDLAAAVGEQPQQPPAPPPLVTVTLQFKTAVHPTTQKSEIVVAAALCHTAVQLEGTTTDTHQMALTIVRPWQSNKFPRDFDGKAHPQLRHESNERALISRLLAALGQWDPDVIVGHNAAGFDLETLLLRCTALKIPMWPRLGRRRRTGPALSGNTDWAIRDALSGRLLCDTWVSAKELLRETTYTLTSLVETQLQAQRHEILAVDVPAYFASGPNIVQLALATLQDAQYVQALMFKLQILPLTKQLTCIAGNLWADTLRSNRAIRTEYLLLHEFRRLKFIPPEKRKAAKSGTNNSKAKYSGGLVLEPKKGLYDSFILLLDFNSLYPSIIQEYNLCFTTIDWSKFVENDEAPIPDADVQKGVLPTVIQTLVDRRRNVKKLLKSEANAGKRQELDIRQKALKLTANSMYGCLGFSNSRFFAQPIAALVTARGRDTLLRAVDIAQNSVGLDVIYGDTDSIMINTRLRKLEDLAKVKQLGEQVKKQVNRQYRTLELEIDGIFRSMLLLKKKKYAAKTIEELPNGKVQYGEELKGLDLVRRDWCIQSKETGKYVTSQILSGQETEVVLDNIHSHLEQLAEKMRAGQLPLEKYVITKGLSKHPKDYPDAKTLPHVQVAKAMLQNNRPVNTGDHIPYIITAPTDEKDANGHPKPSASWVERARHPEDLARSHSALTPDVEWYLAQQILPPIARLCDPIDGTSQKILAEKLKLDARKYGHSQLVDNEDDDISMNFRPASTLSDAERFQTVEKLKIYCYACQEENEFPGVFRIANETETTLLTSGFTCPNPNCIRPDFWGNKNLVDCTGRLLNAMTVWTKGVYTQYYQGLVRCDEPSCRLETRQLSVAAGCPCLRRGCQGQMHSVVTERSVHTHLKYLESLFDAHHACAQLEKTEQFGRKTEILQQLPKLDARGFETLHAYAKDRLQSNAYNWIPKEFWKVMFDMGVKQKHSWGSI